MPLSEINSPLPIGFWKRFFAALVDGILLSLIVLPLLFAFYGWSYLEPEAPRFSAGKVDLFLTWIFPIFLYIGFWIWKQATPGKMLIRSIIVDANTGAKPTIKQWLLRYIGYFLSTLPLGLGYLWVAFDKRKQGWHDKLAGTIVVAKPAAQPHR